jgi:hypothetical protein
LEVLEEKLGLVIHRFVKKINASALGYAIGFLLLIALICTGVLAITSVNKRLEHFYLTKEHLIFDNALALKYGASMSSNSHTLIHVSGDTTDLLKKKWGVFEVISAKTYHRALSVTSTALIGRSTSDQLPVLYIPENNQSLKLAGDALVEGNIAVSERGVDRAYLAGRPFSRSTLVAGNIAKSERFLPPLGSKFESLNPEQLIQDTKELSDLPQDSSFSFQTTTVLYTQMDPIVLTGKLTGNIIIRSFSKITVTKESRLEHLILIAPTIVFEQETKATVQAIASREILCEKDVMLGYPSVCALFETAPERDGGVHQIVVSENSKVLGGILLHSKQPDFRKPVRLHLDVASVVGGMVYNVGETEIKGSILGHCLTQSLALRYGGGENTNHLLDCTLSSKQLPEDFIFPSWLKNNKEGKQTLICRL